MGTTQFKKPSRSRALRANLDYPVIDTDLHTIEFAPILEDYIAKYGGASSVDGIERIEDIRDRYVPNFYFGSEADDPTIAYAFNTKVNPLGVQLNAFWASDSGHRDVPDLTEVLADTWSLVERGALTEANFRDLVFTHPYNFFAGRNPEFFKGTAVEQKLRKEKAA